MKKIILFLFVAFLASKSFAQIFNPVSWDFSHERVSESEVDLIFTATIDEGWYVYSQFCGEGPVATIFHLKKIFYWRLLGGRRLLLWHQLSCLQI